MKGNTDIIIRVINAFGDVIYAALGLLAIWGIYNAILLYRGLRKKSLKPDQSEALLQQVRDLVRSKSPNFDGAIAVCQGPTYWHAALAQLIAVALKNRDKGIAKI